MSPSEDIGRGEATKVLAAAQQRLQALLLEIHEVSLESLDNQIQRATLRKERAERTVGEQTEELQYLHKMAKQIGEPLQPPDAQLYAAVKRDDLSLRAELAGLIARREAIVDCIAEAEDKLNASEEEQRRVLEEFGKVVQLREQQWARMRDLVESAAASETDLQKVEVELAQARAELAERRRLFGRHSAGTQLAQLNQQLVDVQIEIPATEARLKETRESLNLLGELARSSLGIQYERTRQALEKTFEEEQSAAVELARVSRERDAIPAPKIVVLRRGIEPK